MSADSERGDAKPPASARSADSFDELLREAARVSQPAPVDPRAVLSAGAALAGGRLSVLGRIGRGGMGIVYQAFDAERSCRVALKILTRLDAAGVYRLKNEFRSLADVTHPNLVRLHELFADHDSWFFTMELVEGEHFDRWVRPVGVLDESRIRAALPPLVSAVSAIHSAGKLHRDLKPGNVLVTHDGRLVVLDFGLAVDVDPGGIGQTLLEEFISGTPAYMAPEQAAGEPATEASDWYAAGVMLFEALTGRLPFVGRPGELLAAKQRDAAPRVSLLAPTAPPDLAALCDELLERQPSRRPGTHDLQSRLGASPAHAAPFTGSPTLSPRSASEGGVHARANEPVVLLDREAELSTLREAFEASCVSRRPVVVLVAGESGMGKTALCEAFLAELRASGRAVVLSGRSFERESVPFKAFDVVVDELSRYLRKIGDESMALVPRDAFALRRIFPVLERVPSIAEAPMRDVPDAQELRRRAFSAFGELLGRIRDRQPLVVHLDDLQWIDGDSTLLLIHLMRQEDAPHVLLVASHRSEDMEVHPHLSVLYEALQGDARIDVRPLRLSPLSDDAANALLRAPLGNIPEQLVRDAGGNPFLLGELGRYAAAHPHAAVADLTLKSVVLARVAGLDEDSRRLLHVLAVAARPVDLSLAIDAAGPLAGPRTVFDALRDVHLARATGGGALIECFHDRVREALLGALSGDALRDLHAALARAISLRSGTDAEELAVHLLGAGQAEAAAVQLARAADSAFRELSFERAARLYAEALEHGRFGAAETQRLRIAHADSLTYTGRCGLAARHYLDAAQTADGEAAIELQRRAAEQFLISGHRSEGLSTLRSVLGASGIAGPNSGLPLVRLLFQRLWLRLRGIGFALRQAGAIDPRILRRVDACSVAARTLIVREPVKGAIFGTMHLRLALACGEPSRIVEGLATEIFYASTDGSKSTARVERLIAQARSVELHRDEPAAEAYLNTALAARALLSGRFAEAAAAAKTAETLYVERCTGVTGPLNVARCIWAPAVLFMGEFPTAARALAPWMESAREREDLEAEGQLGIYTLYAPLAADDVAAVREGLERALARWRPGHRETAGMTAVHVLAVLECYARSSPPALLRARNLYEPFFRSVLARVQLYRIVVMGYCANLELALAAQGFERGPRLRRAERFASRLGRERVRHGDALASLARAGVANLRGDVDGAVRHLERACADFEADRQMLWSACARLRLGRLVGGSAGQQHCAHAIAEMQGRGVASPERFVSVYAPGYPD